MGLGAGITTRFIRIGLETFSVAGVCAVHRIDIYYVRESSFKFIIRFPRRQFQNKFNAFS